MEDIVIDDKTPVSIKIAKRKKKRNWSTYLIDWVEKAMIIGLLLAINFTLFAGAGSFKIFPTDVTLALEVVYILSGIFIFAFLLMYLVSFSSFFQNVITSAIVGLWAVAMVGQFANFDKHSMFGSFADAYLGHDIGLLLFSFSHIFLGAVVGVAFFIYLVTASKQGIAYFVGILLLAWVGIAFHQYTLRHEKNDYAVLFENKNEKTVEANAKDKRFVYIAIPELTSYNYMLDMMNSKVPDAPANQKLEKTRDVMLGFYIRNGFKYYANAYVNDYDPFYNIAETFNIGSGKDVKEVMQKNVSINGLWRFHNLAPKYVYLKENFLFNIFNRSKYDVRAYQSQGIEMCEENGEINVGKCVEKRGLPISLDKTDYSMKDRTMILLAEWIESMDLLDGFPSLYKLLRTFSDADKLPTLGISYKDIYVIDSLQALDVAGKDIAEDKGNKAYFIYVDLPKMYVYDEFCRLKPLSEWQTKNSLPWVTLQDNFEKRGDYADQIRCLYGKLEEFMQNLRKNGLYENTVVVLQGAVGIDGLGKGNTNDFVNTTKNEKLVSMAIRDPFKNKFDVSYDMCSAPNILKQYLFKKGSCEDFTALNLHPDALEVLKQNIMTYRITPRNIKAAQQNFGGWYNEWAKINQVEALPVVVNNDDIAEESDTLEQGNIQEGREVKAVEVKTVEEQAEQPEAETKNLMQEMQKTQQSGNSDEVQPVPANDNQPQEKIEIKVIEK